MQLIVERDSADLSFVDVAKAAHCSLQTLYSYYGSIENLWIACAGLMLNSLSNRLIDHLQGIEDLKERLRKVFWLMLDYFERHERYVELFTSVVHLNTWMKDESFRQPDIGRVVLEMIEEGQKSGLLTNEVDKITILDFVYGVLFRCVQMRQIRRDELSNVARASVLFEMIWRAIENPEYELLAASKR